MLVVEHLGKHLSYSPDSRSFLFICERIVGGLDLDCGEVEEADVVDIF